MKCHKSQKLLSAYLDGELPESKHREVRAHVADCHACQARIAQYREIEQAHLAATQRTVPTDFVYQVKREIARQHAGKRPVAQPSRTIWDILFRPAYVKIPLQVAAAVAVLFVAVFAMRPFSPPTTIVKQPTPSEGDKELAGAPKTPAPESVAVNLLEPKMTLPVVDERPIAVAKIGDTALPLEADALKPDPSINPSRIDILKPMEFEIARFTPNISGIRSEKVTAPQAFVRAPAAVRPTTAAGEAAKAAPTSPQISLKEGRLLVVYTTNPEQTALITQNVAEGLQGQIIAARQTQEKPEGIYNILVQLPKRQLPQFQNQLMQSYAAATQETELDRVQRSAIAATQMKKTISAMEIANALPGELVPSAIGIADVPLGAPRGVTLRQPAAPAPPQPVTERDFITVEIEIHYIP